MSCSEGIVQINLLLSPFTTGGCIACSCQCHCSVLSHALHVGIHPKVGSERVSLSHILGFIGGFFSVLCSRDTANIQVSLCP